MPGYKGHLVGGAVAFACALYFLQDYCSSGLVAVQWCGFAIAGALFPDIDVKSKGQKYFYWVVLAALILLFGLAQYHLLALCSVVSITPMLCKHRGIFHEPWFVIAIPAGLGALGAYLFPMHAASFFFYAIFFSIGALSHLYLDRGFRGIWPKKKFKKF